MEFSGKVYAGFFKHLAASLSAGLLIAGAAVGFAFLELLCKSKGLAHFYVVGIRTIATALFILDGIYVISTIAILSYRSVRELTRAK